MTKFGQPVEQEGGFALSFKNDVDFNEAELSGQAADAVETCRRLIDVAICNVRQPDLSGEVYSLARFYFRMEEWEFRDNKEEILRRLVVLQKAFSKRFLIKLTDRIEGRTKVSDTADGLTPMRSHENSIKKKQFPRKNVPYRLAGFDDRRKRFLSRQYGNLSAGSVHLKTSVFAKGESAAEVLIHEFCHRYLGLHDGPDGDWYFNSTTGFEPPIETDDAGISEVLMNTADAMAWFIVKVGGKIENMDRVAINPKASRCIVS